MALDRSEEPWFEASFERRGEACFATTNGKAPSFGPGRRLVASERTSRADRVLVAELPERGLVKRIAIYGSYVPKGHQRNASASASLTCFDHDLPMYHAEFASGRHLFDARQVDVEPPCSGDGVWIETVGEARLEDSKLRVDRLLIELAEPTRITQVSLQALSPTADWWIFAIEAAFEEAHGCPFHSRRGGIALSEVPSLVRTGDRARMQKAIEQLRLGLEQSRYLDDARGQALAFVAALMAGALEMGAERSMHRIVLETARSLDRVTTLEQVVKATMATVLELAQPMLAEPTNPNAKLIDRALVYIERRFALPISDSEIADHLGLSASHFRFLFREATGQPFHKYLVSKRLERARQLLVEQGLPVSEVAAAVGFANASHFSRAFAQRFGTSPIQMRRAAS